MYSTVLICSTRFNVKEHEQRCNNDTDNLLTGCNTIQRRKVTWYECANCFMLLIIQ